MTHCPTSGNFTTELRRTDDISFIPCLRDVINYLVYVEVLDDGVEGRVEVVEQRDDLHGRALRRHGREAHDVAEVDGDLLERLGLDSLALDQRQRH